MTNRDRPLTDRTPAQATGTLRSQSLERRGFGVLRRLRCIGWAAAIGSVLLVSGCGRDEDEADDLPADASGETSESDLLVGIDLGTFRVRETRPSENQKIDLRFAVQAAVGAPDRERFESFRESHANALRDQIIIAVRTAETPEFDEAELKTLRRRMLLRISGILERPPVQDLYLTDFRCQID